MYQSEDRNPRCPCPQPQACADRHRQAQAGTGRHRQAHAGAQGTADTQCHAQSSTTQAKRVQKQAETGKRQHTQRWKQATINRHRVAKPGTGGHASPRQEFHARTHTNKAEEVRSGD